MLPAGSGLDGGSAGGGLGQSADGGDAPRAPALVRGGGAPHRAGGAGLAYHSRRGGGACAGERPQHPRMILTNPLRPRPVISNAMSWIHAIRLITPCGFAPFVRLRHADLR
eukprot:914598-Prorocentrum_minimum.AAC.1